MSLLLRLIAVNPSGPVALMASDTPFNATDPTQQPAAFPLADSTTAATTPTSTEMSTSQMVVVLAIAVVYPFSMVLFFVGLRRCMVSHGPYAGMTEEEILVADQRLKLRLIRAWCRSLCGCCGAQAAPPSPRQESPPRRQDDIFVIERGLRREDRPPRYDLAVTMAKPPRGYQGPTGAHEGPAGGYQGPTRGHEGPALDGDVEREEGGSSVTGRDEDLVPPPSYIDLNFDNESETAQP